MLLYYSCPEILGSEWFPGETVETIHSFQILCEKRFALKCNAFIIKNDCKGSAYMEMLK